jgi:hypothetical protein
MPVEGLAQLLDANLSQGVQYVEVQEVFNFGDLAGPDRTQDRSAFAEALAGTADKKSREYKAARRNVERWVKGRRPMTISRRRIVGARRQSNARLSAFRVHGGDCRLQVSWYESRKPEWLPPNSWVHLRQQVMRRIIRYWSEDTDEGRQLAAGLLFREFIDRYQVPNPEDWERDVIVIDLRLVPSKGSPDG